MEPVSIKFADYFFQDLSLDEWYKISSLRERVFVVEQNCPYLDADGKDPGAHHIIGIDSSGNILAYARIVYPEDQIVPISLLSHLKNSDIDKLVNRYKNTASTINLPAIGRVVLEQTLRGTGVSHLLMDHTIQCAKRLYDYQPIFLSAQTPLHDFYARHGFVQSGPGYLEDDIPHIPMLRICAGN